MVSGKKAKQVRREEIRQRHATSKKGLGRISTGWVIGLVAILFFGGILGFVAFDSIQKQQAKAAVATDQTPANTVNDGWTITASGVETATPYAATAGYDMDAEVPEKNITMYVDYDCPHCGEFDRANGEQIKSWLEDGTLDSVSIHPLAFMSEYSVQAFNAMSCIADRNPATLFDTHLALMQNQPGGVAMGEEEFTELLTNAGNPTSDPAFIACVEEEAYTPFITAASDRARTGPLPATKEENLKVEGTPTILINGSRYSGDPNPEALSAAVIGGNLFSGVGGETSEVEESSPAEEEPAGE